MKSTSSYNYKDVLYREFSLKTKGAVQQNYAHPDGFRYWLDKAGNIVGRNKRSNDISTYQIATPK